MYNNRIPVLPMRVATAGQLFSSHCFYIVQHNYSSKLDITHLHNFCGKFTVNGLPHKKSIHTTSYCRASNESRDLNNKLKYFLVSV